MIRKRLLSAFMSMVLVLGLCPMPAYAEISAGQISGFDDKAQVIEETGPAVALDEVSSGVASESDEHAVGRQLRAAAASVAADISLSDSGLTKLEKPDVSDLKSAWAALPEEPAGLSIFKTLNDNSTYSAAELTDESFEYAEAYLNFIRYSAGLESVALDDTLNKNAAQGALILAKLNTGLTHTPSTPSGVSDAAAKAGKYACATSNISSASSKLSAPNAIRKAIQGQINDSGENNLQTLGHRRWLLNPTLATTGIGSAYVADSSWQTMYTDIRVFNYPNSTYYDSSYGSVSDAGSADYDFISWPASGAFANNVFEMGTPWSISLNPLKFQAPDASVKVEVTRQKDSKSWTMTSDDAAPSTQGKYMLVENSGYGVNNCIIFNPGSNNVGEKAYGGDYTVNVTGLKTQSGTNATLTYEVSFFDASVADEPDDGNGGGEKPENPGDGGDKSKDPGDGDNDSGDIKDPGDGDEPGDDVGDGGDDPEEPGDGDGGDNNNNDENDDGDTVEIGYADSIFENTPVAVSLTEDDVDSGTSIRYFRFVPSKDGVYNIASSNANGDPYVWLYDSRKSLIDSNDDGGDGRDFSLDAEMKTGEVYYIGAGFYDSEAGSYTMTVTNADVPEIAVDVAHDVVYNNDEDRDAIVSFKPEMAGVYYFYSTGDADVRGWLYSADGELLGDDDNGLDGKNFLIEADLEADTTYFLKTKPSGDENAAYQVTVTQNAPATNPNSGYGSLEGKDLTGKYINLAFVVDTTGSMDDNIASVRDNLNAFVDALVGTNATLRIALIEYRDIDPDEEGGPETTVVHRTKDKVVWFESSEVDDLKSEISSLETGGGGDDPESLVDALANLVEPDVMTFNSTAAKFAFVVTDAGYKVANTHDIKSMDELIERLSDADIATSVITDRDYYSVYDGLTSQTGGVLMDIEDSFAESMGTFAGSIAEKTEAHEVDKDIVPVTGVQLGDDLSVPVGRIRNFTPVVQPANATDKSVVWDVDDEGIAKVSEESNEDLLVVQGISEGTTYIRARSRDGGYAASFKFEVLDKYVDEEAGTLETCDIDDIVEAAVDGDSGLDTLTYYGDRDEGTSVDDAKQASIYTAIKETSKTVSFVYDDKKGDVHHKWTFAGSEIVDPSKSIDMDVDILDAEGEVKELAEDAELNELKVVDFSHSGELPGRADVDLAVGLEDGDDYSLYYYNQAESKLEKDDQNVKVTDGVAAISITHCSTYIIGRFAETPPVAIDITNATVTLSKSNYTYTGSPITPTPTVKLDGATLIANADYTVSYKNNTNPGTATVTVTGVGKYDGTASTTFSITSSSESSGSSSGSSGSYSDTRKSIAYAQVSLSESSFVFDGTKHEPDVSVTLGSITLDPATDYFVTYDDNVNAGTAHVTVTGKGNYKGTVTPGKTFEIARRQVTVTPNDAGKYVGEDDPGLSATALGCVGSDTVVYRVSRVPGEKEGSYVISATGEDVQGNYSVQFDTATFTILPRKSAADGTSSAGDSNQSPGAQVPNNDISKATIALGRLSYAYTGNPITPAPIVLLGTIVLRQDVDYRVLYQNNTRPGSASIAVIGEGAYTGIALAAFTITKADNTLQAKNRSAKISYSKLKKAKRSVAGVKVSGAVGKVSYKKVSVSKKAGKFKVNKNTGKITVAKKTPKGSYRVKISVTAAGNGDYGSKTTIATVTVKVK